MHHTKIYLMQDAQTHQPYPHYMRGIIDIKEMFYLYFPPLPVIQH